MTKSKKLTPRALDYLVGLYNDDEALEYLRTECEFSDDDAASLVKLALAAVERVFTAARRP